MTRSSCIRVCACGWEGDLDDCRFRGPQETDVRGEWALLANCPNAACNTTFVQYVVKDASRCFYCKELILGDAGDDTVKVIRTSDDENIIACLDCSRTWLAPPRVPGAVTLRRLGVDVGMY